MRLVFRLNEGKKSMIAEHVHLKVLAEKHPRYFSIEPLAYIKTKRGDEPIFAYQLYDHKIAKPETLPVLGLFAGVHGLEFIGVRILLSFLEHLTHQIQWNGHLKYMLKQIRIVGIPIVNPAGFIATTRANANGVDLMRNAPVTGPKPFFLVGGHRFSAKLPYYRGNGRLEAESKVLIDFVKEVLWQAPFSISLDLHSGFGGQNYIWTPYAKQFGLPPTWSDFMRIKTVLKDALQYFKYKFKPQSAYYTADGDLWDYMYDQYLLNEGHISGRFLPMTLEVGTWNFIKKAPLSGLRLWNYFNPSRPEGFKKVVQQHIPLLLLLSHITSNWQRIFPSD